MAARVDWDDLRVFLQVARSGQMTAAAKLLDMDHATISRRIARLEQQIGRLLFDRAGRRLKITESGTRMLAASEAMESALLKDVTALEEDTGEVSGCVRIGTSEGFGSYYLARRFTPITENAPKMSVELLALPRTYSLASREVDLAITMDRPATGSLRIRKLTSYDLGLFAARSYIDAHGSPSDVSALADHQWCGYIRELLFTDELDFLTFNGVSMAPRYRTTGVASQLEAIRSGSVIGILPVYMAVAAPELERILPEEVTLTRDYWMAVHEDVAEAPRVRKAMEAIERQVRIDRALFQPG